MVTPTMPSATFQRPRFAEQWQNLQTKILDHLTKAQYIPVDVSRYLARPGRRSRPVHRRKQARAARIHSGVLMSGFMIVKKGVNWSTTGGLFDWTMEFLESRLSDVKTARYLRGLVEDNVQMLALPDLPSQTRQEIVTVIQNELVAAGEREIPNGDGKPFALNALRELVALTYLPSDD